MKASGRAVGHSGQRLKRSLGAWAAGAFVVTNMIGTGIFTIPAFVRWQTGSGLSALGVWAAGALLALCGAFCYAELATRMPRVGGEYHYLTRIYGPVWGFLSGWISFLVGFSAAVAAASIGAGAYILAFFDLDPGYVLIPGTGITQVALLASLIVLLLGLVHSAGMRPGGRLQSALAGLTLGAIVLLVVAGLGSGRGDWTDITASTAANGSWWVALIQVSFAYSGWNAAAYLAGEVHRPSRTLPRALLGGTLVVGAAYLALNILFLYALPEGSWHRNIAVGQEAAQALFGSLGGDAITALIILAILGSISAMTAAGPRVYYAMARDGLAPAFFGRLSSRSAPAAAILSQSVVAACLALTGAFESLLIYIGSVLLLFNALAIAGVFVVRRRFPEVKPAFSVPGYPLTPLLFLAVVLVSWGRALIDEPVPTGLALLTLVVGVLFYFVGIKRRWITYSPPDESETRTEAEAA
ncbi:MAG TPA: amino acid permease [Acidobacteriota bacterium]|nr:amino acid permease [Acidobacteriota bacterium]